MGRGNDVHRMFVRWMLHKNYCCKQDAVKLSTCYRLKLLAVPFHTARPCVLFFIK